MSQQHPSLLGRSPQDFHAPFQLDGPFAHPLLEPFVLVLELQVQPPGLQQIPDAQERLVLVERLGQEVMSSHRQRTCLASGVLSAVRTRMGRYVPWGMCLLSSAMTSNPSMWGIIRSRMMTSGLNSS